MPDALMQLLLLAAGVCLGSGDGGVATSRKHAHHHHDDAFHLARCESHCWHLHNNKNTCIKSCLSRPFTKAGLCPSNNTILAPFEAVCLKTCLHDSDCEALKKCCQHNCGVTCQRPQHLDQIQNVPRIPRDVRVREGPKKRTVLLEWTQKETSTILYLIEERHHAGHNFIEQHLSEWALCAKTAKTKHVLKDFVKPGWWYQFRVAAVNENGSRGFSEISPTFSIAMRPKPPKAPNNLTFDFLPLNPNGTISGELRWKSPRSDLPIERYKIFWSRRLYGATPLNSVFVQQQMVSKDQTKFLLQNLEPNTYYYVQIQALVQYGKKRLKGPKSELFVDTSKAPSYKASQMIEGLQVQKKFWDGQLRVRVTWKASKNFEKFTIRLWRNSCKHGGKYLKLAATTKATHFDFNDLNFSCNYRVGVGGISEGGTKLVQDIFATFETPDCSEFRKNNRGVRCLE